MLEKLWGQLAGEGKESSLVSPGQDSGVLWLA